MKTLNRSLAVLSVILLLGAGCDEGNDPQTDCERYGERAYECASDHVEAADWATMCEAAMDGNGCDDACLDGWECSVECSNLEDCGDYLSCVRGCY